MAEDKGGPRGREWLSRRGVWFWAIGGTATSVLLLWGGSQIAHDRGQSVEWYTGFGQWLGGLGSLIAAAVALWIAVTDRRQAERQRRHAERQQNADLTRQAGLAQVAANTQFGQRDIAGPRFAALSVSLVNRRTDRIFDVEITKFVLNGEDIDTLELDEIELFPDPDNRSRRIIPKLDGIMVGPDQTLIMFIKNQPRVAADYATVAYTDSSGRRWKVDTNRGVQRLI